MSTIKKVYVELYNLLNSNQEILVGDLMDQVLPLMLSKKVDTNHRYDENGDLWVYCYYHKEWENTTTIEYGSKVSNKSTGLNTMCKVGVNQWTKQQRDYKQGKADLLDQLANNEFPIEELSDKLEELEDEKDKIVSYLDHLGGGPLESEEEEETTEEE